jgi:alpha-tubulin suppressor-like RCC1 family protein
MPNFSGPEGELSELYLSETDILERYVGNQLWGWGYNGAGQLGTDNTTNYSSPVQTVSGGTNWKQVTRGQGYTAAIKTDNSLWVWGYSDYGSLATNDVGVIYSSPIQTVSAGTNWKQVSAGWYHTTAIKTDGTLWLWGINDYGQLGTNDLVHRSSPVQTVAGGTNWKQVSSTSLYHTAAIKTDGTLWIWGLNYSGQLGDNTTVAKSSPVQTVSGGTNWKQVSCGGAAAEGHTAAIKTDGTLWLWGDNFFGQLGDGSFFNHRSSPVQTVSGGTNWKQVSCGERYTAAIKTDGTLWLWGRNYFATLGTNDFTQHSSPVQTIAGGTNWKQVSCGYNGTAAIKTDGTLWVWGNNDGGQLGDNTTTSKSSPVQTAAGGTNWKQVACGANHSAAITYTES